MMRNHGGYFSVNENTSLLEKDITLDLNNIHSPNQKNHLTTLPEIPLHLILSHLTLKEISNCAQVNTEMNVNAKKYKPYQHLLRHMGLYKDMSPNKLKRTVTVSAVSGISAQSLQIALIYSLGWSIPKNLWTIVLSIAATTSAAIISTECWPGDVIKRKIRKDRKGYISPALATLGQDYEKDIQDKLNNVELRHQIK